MIRLQNLINKQGVLKYKLDHAKCIRHKNQNSYCKFIFNEKNGKKATIHGRFGNLVVNNIEFFCKKAPSCKYYLLQHQQNIIASNLDYVKVNDEKIYKIKKKYVSHSLLLHLNEITLNGNDKLFGMLYPSSSFYIILYNSMLFYHYFTLFYIILNKDIGKHH